MAENRDILNERIWTILPNDKLSIVKLFIKNEKRNNQPFNCDRFTSFLFTRYRQKSGKSGFYRC
ncbi:protein of unknown function [Chryseobacterium sp. JV274]|nr:protein of unknown function [Chryseobacterium sp. JV274]